MKNIAIEQGGAIYYNFRRPAITDINFTNNDAVYGPNIASYPVRIVQDDSINDNIVLTDVASGIKYSGTVRLSIIDYDNQVMNLVNSSQIKITPATEGAALKGTDSSTLVMGQTEFDNLQFEHYPGASNTQYLASCKLIDSDKTAYLDLPTNDTITVSFRFCKPGEAIIDNSTCSPCNAGTYSLTWNSTQCIP